MPFLKIDSPKNPRVAAAAKLLDKRARSKAGLYLIEGWRLVKAALIAEAPIEEIFATPEALGREGAGMMTAKLLNEGVSIIETTDAAIKRLSDTVSPQGIVAVARRFDKNIGELRLPKRALVIVADAVGDPGNFGSLARLAGAAAVDALIALPGCVDWTSPKVLRASMGGVFQVPIVSTALPALRDLLKRRHIRLAATVGSNADPIDEVDLTQGVALVFGNEANGVRPELLTSADTRLSIPMPGDAESLNVTAAAAIVVFEALRQRRAQR